MMASELAIIGKLSVGAPGADCEATGSSSADVSSNVGKDLGRTCTSTSYTYMYAIEV